MNQNNNLDQFHTAYGENERFFFENQQTELWYCQRVCDLVKSYSMNKGLSLGLGHGFTLNSLLDNLKGQLSQYWVIEGSPKMIDLYKAKFSMPSFVNIVHSYFEEFHTEEKFDFIEMGFVLEHVDDPVQILKIFKKFINENGVIFVAVPNALSLHRQIGFHAHLLEDYYQLSEMDHKFGHQRYFDLNSLSECVQEAGLKIKRREGIFLKPLTEKQLQSLDLSPPIWRALFEVGVKYPEICNSIFLEVSL